MAIVMVHKVMTELKADALAATVISKLFPWAFVISVHEEGMKHCWNTAVLEP